MLRSKLIAPCLVYLLLTGFIVGWWTLTIQKPLCTQHACTFVTPEALTVSNSVLLKELSNFQRDPLRDALAGNANLMIELIEQWHSDAKQLASLGVEGIRTLSPENYLQSHLLAHLLRTLLSEELRTLNCLLNFKTISDDCGINFPIPDSSKNFLPQSYVAASFLLAIASNKEIMAVPRGLRYLPQLYPSSVLDQIPDNINGLSNEKLHLGRPDLVFVAPYSHPPMIETLHRQGIKLYTLRACETLENIQNSLLKMGHATHHLIEAQLLVHFLDACFISIENRFLALQHMRPIPQHPLKMLCLDYRQHYRIPTTKDLTGQLIQRALHYCPHLTCPIPKSEHEWTIPIDYESIVQANPDCLIISTPWPLDSSKDMQMHAASQDLNAFQHKKVFYVDKTIQESPTQYIALAYYDLYQAITAAQYS